MYNSVKTRDIDRESADSLAQDGSARAYRAGRWETHRGWKALQDPGLVDLAIWTPPRAARRWARATEGLALARPAGLDAEARALVVVWREQFPRFEPDLFLAWLEAQGAALQVATWRRGDRLLGVSLNLRYEDVMVAQLLCWDRAGAPETHLGKADFVRLAVEAREQGCSLLAVGELLPYKRALFASGLVSPPGAP